MYEPNLWIYCQFLWFLRECIVDTTEFKEIKKSQGLTVGFDELAGVLINLFNKCISQPHEYNCILDGDTLIFLQFLQHKRVELLRVMVKDTCEDAKRAFASFRFRKLQLCVASFNRKEL